MWSASLVFPPKMCFRSSSLSHGWDYISALRLTSFEAHFESDRVNDPLFWFCMSCFVTKQVMHRHVSLSVFQPPYGGATAQIRALASHSFCFQTFLFCAVSFQLRWQHLPISFWVFRLVYKVLTFQVPIRKSMFLCQGRRCCFKPSFRGILGFWTE
jgi:hypothetical protein